MLDCLVIGAGHAGLMCGHLLKERQLDYLVVDGTGRVGDVWRNRPANLTLFTSRRFCQLADLPLEGDQDGYATGVEFGDYLERFAQQKQLNLGLGAAVVRLSRSGDAFVAELADGRRIEASTVINATGANQQPLVPGYAAQLAPAVRQITAPAFRNAASIVEEGSVVVVGDGASGRQIALELSASHPVVIARGRKRKLLPNRLLGRDIFWWLTKAGVLFASRDSVVAKIMRKRDPIPVASANDARLAAQGVVLKPRACGAEGEEILFEDGSRVRAAVVIWCGGYRENTEWLDLPAVVRADTSAFSRGATVLPGYYVVGRKWLNCRASELVMGIEKDASLAVAQVRQFVDSL